MAKPEEKLSIQNQVSENSVNSKLPKESKLIINVKI